MKSRISSSGTGFHLFERKIRPGLPAHRKIRNVTVHRCGFGSPVDKFFCRWSLRPDVFNRDRKSPIGRSGETMEASRPWPATWSRPKTKVSAYAPGGRSIEHYAKAPGRSVPAEIFRRADAVQPISRFPFRNGPSVWGSPAIGDYSNGVDLPRFAAVSPAGDRERWRSSWALRPRDIAIVTAPRLSLKNGVDDLIRAVAQLPERFHAVVAGEGGTMTSWSHSPKRRASPSACIFSASVASDELPGILRASRSSAARRCPGSGKFIPRGYGGRLCPSSVRRWAGFRISWSMARRACFVGARSCHRSLPP